MASANSPASTSSPPNKPPAFGKVPEERGAVQTGAIRDLRDGRFSYPFSTTGPARRSPGAHARSAPICSPDSLSGRPDRITWQVMRQRRIVALELMQPDRIGLPVPRSSSPEEHDQGEPPCASSSPALPAGSARPSSPSSSVPVTKSSTSPLGRLRQSSRRHGRRGCYAAT